MTVIVRVARLGDIGRMTELIEQRRERYEHVQPVFWRRAAGSANKTRLFYTYLILVARHTLTLVAEKEGNLLGFLIVRRLQPPPVYDPGGPTAIIDDFCVLHSDDWTSVGGKLLAHARTLGRNAGWSQIIVVCGAEDEPKAEFLQSAQLSVVTNWWRGPA